jgi:hypothetical protein
LFFSAAPARAETPCRADVEKIRAAATALVEIGPRQHTTKEAGEARAWIARELGELGQFVRAEEIGSVPVPEASVGPITFRHGGVRLSSSDNLWLRFGSERGKARLIMAHYDSVWGSPGAIDNAASVGIALELARCLARVPPPFPVIIAFSGAEEDGLLGARRLVGRLAGDLELAVSLDVLGHQAPVAINGLSDHWDRARLEWLRERVESSGADAYAPIIHRAVSRELPQLERSDHGPFAEAGVPSLHLYGRGPERIFLAYHTDRDDMSQVRDDALANAHALAAEIAYASERLPPATSDPGMWVTTPWGPEVISAWIVIGIEATTVVGVMLALLALWFRRHRRWRGSGLGIAAMLGAYVAGWGMATAAGVFAVRHLGDPLAFAHAPGRFTLGLTAVSLAGFGLIALVLTRRWTVVGGARYHVAAAMLPLAIGAAALIAGSFELAWLPLEGALAFALAALLIDRPFGCALATAAGAALVAPLLAPPLLREAVFHGFYPPQLPFSGYLALVLLAPWLAVTGLLAEHLPDPRRGTRIAVGLLLLVIAAAGIAALIMPEPLCPAETVSAGLACEIS